MILTQSYGQDVSCDSCDSGGGAVKVDWQPLVRQGEEVGVVPVHPPVYPAEPAAHGAEADIPAETRVGRCLLLARSGGLVKGVELKYSKKE